MIGTLKSFEAKAENDCGPIKMICRAPTLWFYLHRPELSLGNCFVPRDPMFCCLMCVIECLEAELILKGVGTFHQSVVFLKIGYGPSKKYELS